MEMADPLVVDGIELKDKLRFFQGDHPELQFESGNSIGGNYPCHCGCPKFEFNNPGKGYKYKLTSLEWRREKLTQTRRGRQENEMNPLSNLKAQDLFNEVMDRNLLEKDSSLLKDYLEHLLKTEMAGLVRPPALCKGCVNISTEETNTSKYEISPSEPLHDLKGHIRNLWDLLPDHLPTNLKEEFEKEVAIILGRKDKYRGTDFRLFTNLN
ncbi:uncharacterized protein [Clytia hemisphaerica]|uniref:uncharacterized protein n=1 Tax=Clytia hemisphaerica TaxID=252671 RepID=UPI0034D69F5C